MISWLMALALVAQADVEEASKRDILDQISSGRYKRVAVCPQPICMLEDKESFASAGPKGTEWCDDLSRYLQTYSDQHGFELVNNRTVKNEMENVTLDDLAEESKLKELSKSIGADALVILEVSPDGSEWNGSPQVYNLLKNTVRKAETVELPLTLSDYAFMGHSFEARRWNNNRMELVGFQEGADENNCLGMSYNYELSQYGLLNYDLPHPMTRDQNDLPPYGFAIVVNGQQRELENIDGKLYVALEPNENFGVRLWNDSGRPVMAGLYIDGVNTIGRKFENPFDTPAFRRWSLVPGYAGTVNGWWTPAVAGQAQTLERFKIVALEDSVAFGEAVDGKFGMITCIFYTNGVDGINVPKEDLASQGDYLFAVGKEAPESVTYKLEGAQPGLMLCAMTINYRTSEELEELRNPSQNPPKTMPPRVTEVPEPKPDLLPMVVTPEPEPKPMPAKEDRGEDVSFTASKTSTDAKASDAKPSESKSLDE